MSKKKKIITITITILIVLTTAFIIMFVFGYGPFKPKDKKDDERLKQIKILTKNYKTEFIVLGDNIEFDDDLYVKNINKITKDNIVSDDSFVYSVLVINDIEGNVSLSDKEFDIIAEALDNAKINFYYFGTNHLQGFIDKKITRQPVIPENEQFIGVSYENDVRFDVNGMWTDIETQRYLSGDKEFLAYAIINDTISTIKYDVR